MTLKAMQEHEEVTLHYANTDFRRQGAVKLALDHISSGRVLDMRCLEGGVIIPLAKEGLEAKGLDGFQGAVDLTNRHAEQSGINESIALLWDLDELPAECSKETFDCVVCFDLLNHVKDDRKTLTQIGEILKPGGRLILLVPAFPGLLGKRDESLGHLRRYSKQGLTSLLVEFGFGVEKIRYWNALALPLYVVVEKFLQRRLSDSLRYRCAEKTSSLFGPIIRFWFNTVERSIALPFGLSLFVVTVKE